MAAQTSGRGWTAGRKVLVLLAFLMHSLGTLAQNLSQTEGPRMNEYMTRDVQVAEGLDAAITCVVHNIQNSVVIWKKFESGKSGPRIITVGQDRVTQDERIRVIHDEGGDVWVLAIRNSAKSDSGLYVCETNTNPPLKSFHNLTVYSIHPPRRGTNSDNSTHTSEDLLSSPSVDLLPPEATMLDSYAGYKGRGSILAHNYTDCCMRNNVSSKCFGFCALQSILDGSPGDATACENEFPSVVRCMADGRYHVPCCVHEGVPDICQDLCRGEYTIVTDNVKTHFSCPSFIERTLSCIADGIELLPSSPIDVDVVAVSESILNVTWSPPEKNAATVTEFIINVTALRSFDVPFTGLGYGIDLTPEEQSDSISSEASVSSDPGKKMERKHGKQNNSSNPDAEDKVEVKMRQIKVHEDVRETQIMDLQPFTMYEIEVIAFNIHGQSLPSNRIRALTLAPGVERPEPGSSPKLPNIRSCCVSQGVDIETCVDRMCDPKETTNMEITDLMICAPWASNIFTCLADKKDHTPCCRQRGLPDPCTELCSGNITSLDFRYFSCLQYKTQYQSCLMEGYGVLPSEPRKVRVSHITHDFAMVIWSHPKRLGKTVNSYNIHYRALSTFEVQYHVIRNAHSPYILENLYDNAEYEVYIEAVNEHGVGSPSDRVVFRTASILEDKDDGIENIDPGTYNETACCVKAGMSDKCLPLCTYDASMSNVRSLAVPCISEFHPLLRCAAGGRDHKQCCEKRGVSDPCLSLCSAVVPDSFLAIADNCLPFIGNIVQCFEEGTKTIPGPVEEFHINLITDSSVGLAWEAPAGSDSSSVSFQVFYEKVDNMDVPKSDPSDLKSVNVTTNSVEVRNLTEGQTYRFYAVSFNQNGTSLPSSIILVNVTSKSFNGTSIAGVPSAPHSLVVGDHGATYVQVIWQPPEFVHHTDVLKYNVYFKTKRSEPFSVKSILVNSLTLKRLVPNSQYIVYVTASNDKGESSPSETLVAWTDPAHSPFVEPPRIQPSDFLLEGHSMTVVCVALGDPTPTISLYINGELMKQQRDRHLTFVVSNVTRDMRMVSCFANNGYGTPMQAEKEIQITYGPEIIVPEISLAQEGDSAVIECDVLAWPQPKVAFWKDTLDFKGRRTSKPLINGVKYLIKSRNESDVELSRKYKYFLKIYNVSKEDVGNYSCHAENEAAESKRSFSLKIRTSQSPAMQGDINQCCQRENVSPQCLSACTIYMDIQTVIDKPECIPDYSKLIKCYADGRDHRACCSRQGVPRNCLEWCRGEPKYNSDLCVIRFSDSILGCFKKNRDKLPGPPENVQVEILSDTSVKVSWDKPTVNSQHALTYRVFWRPAKTNMSAKQQHNDTDTTSIIITGLKPGMEYETFLKVGGPEGISIPTRPMTFFTEDNFISSARTGGSSAGAGVGIAFLIILIIGLMGGVSWILYRRRMGNKPPGAIAFENPSYIRETNPDLSIPSNHTNGNAPVNGNVSSVSSGISSNGWHSETLHAPRQESEVAPTLYEELRLGSEGAGFRRLK